MQPRFTTRRALEVLIVLSTMVAALLSAPAAHADPPANPVFPTIVATDGGAGVTFGDPGDVVTGYEYSADDGATWQPLSYTIADDGTRTGTITGLTNGTTYAVRIRSANDDGVGPPSDPAVSVIAGRPAAPSFAATATDRGATIDIAAPAGGGFPLTGYDVSVSEDATLRWVHYDTTADPYTVTTGGLANGTTYTVSVRAVNSQGPGLVGVSTVVPDVAPQAPTNVQASPGDGQSTVTFDPAATNGGTPVTSYTVTADPGGATASCDGAGECAVTGLTNGTAYTFTVTATNTTSLVSEPSAPSAAVVPRGAPLAPAGIALVGTTATTISVSFAAAYPAGSPLTAYQVSSDNGARWTTVATARRGSRLVATATGLTPGVYYVLRVRAVNGEGVGVASAGVRATTAPATLGTPGVRPGTAMALVTWQPSRQVSTTGYTVYARPGRATCTTYDRLDTSCLIGAVSGVRTTFVVVARNRGSASAASRPSRTIRAAAVPVPRRLPAVPGGLSAGRGKKVAAGRRVTLATAGFLPGSSVALVAYGSSRKVVGRAVASSTGSVRSTVRVPRGRSGRLTFVAFGVTELGSPKAVGRTLRRVR